MRKVICMECEKLIEGTEEPPEYRVCSKCNAQKKGLVIETEMYTQELPDKVKPAVLLVFKIRDTSGKDVLEFGVDYEKVKEWYKEMKTLDEETIDSDSSK